MEEVLHHTLCARLASRCCMPSVAGLEAKDLSDNSGAMQHHFRTVEPSPSPSVDSQSPENRMKSTKKGSKLAIQGASERDPNPPDPKILKNY